MHTFASLNEQYIFSIQTILWIFSPKRIWRPLYHQLGPNENHHDDVQLSLIITLFGPSSKSINYIMFLGPIHEATPCWVEFSLDDVQSSRKCHLSLWERK